ncbi:signal transduction histidine kinase/ActR/RegA family two-component response regulator [Microbacterium trichothecenolyticum]|uniref:hybrid sensor histidine kinase/response regulator n=1 Tax=Microbacterium trichothecenolyticum TaxID=69370 RepID=UPI002861681B|nr:GAF domain-containing protein [Microbacterium trichothecenolyticum]MDR7112203.1 signal transduction histidine kinase/ActR/RegA family two-component response regulator [Microbacterium trichothecenolyticum]
MERSDGAGEGELETPQRGYTDATEQFAAMNEVLLALGRSASDPDSALDTIVESARRLCRSDAAQVYLVDGDYFALSSWVGVPSALVEHITAHPFRIDRASLLGRVARDRKLQQIPDVLSDAEYGRQDAQELGHYRTLMSAPMLLDDEVVGVLSLWRTHVSPFDESAQAALQAFAAQAAVVVRQIDLVRALEDRSVELARKVDQLEALSEVGEAVSSSLVLDEVLTTIIMNAVRFAGCDGGSIMEYVEHEHAFTVRSAYASDRLLERLRGIKVDLDTTLVGRAARERHPIAVPDLDDVELDIHLRLLHEDGWRSMVAVPVLRGDRIVGALVVRRRTPGEFSADTMDFLENFASQSALAVWNAQLFRELETKSAELEIASRHKSEFLASMSHELRTPLNAVIGFSEVLLERMFGELNDRQDEYLRDILGSGRHLLQLLNDILDLSKVEAGRMALEPSTFSLRSALEYGASMVRERAARHGIRLSIDVDADLDTVESDELRVKQVLVNLLSNAVKFTPDGGSVTVTARGSEHEIAVAVADTGIGIAPADRERIFESFQQGRRGLQSEEGTGLGLTLCRRIVAILGGTMWLESEVGVGSTFGFTIPRRVPLPMPAADDEAGRPMIVVVEDDRASLDLTSAYLDGLGVEVVIARDGDEGLSAIRRHVPAAVLLDIRLPRTDGWEVLRRVRADDATAAVPVIVVSIVDERARGLAMGASAYLVKPVRRDALVGALRDVGALAGAIAASAGGGEAP